MSKNNSFDSMIKHYNKAHLCGTVLIKKSRKEKK